MPRRRKHTTQKNSSIKSKKLNVFLAALLALSGIAFISVPRIQQNAQTHTRNTAEPIAPDPSFQTTASAYAIPVRIVMPSLSLDLEVVPSALKRGYWETSETSASYGEKSGIPGEKGNTVIFAHARDGLFGSLRNSKPGDRVYVFTQNNYFTYTIESLTEVKPTDVYTVKPTEDERLTLFTCSGFFDSKRLVVVAKPLFKARP